MPNLWPALRFRRPLRLVAGESILHFFPRWNRPRPFRFENSATSNKFAQLGRPISVLAQKIRIQSHRLLHLNENATEVRRL
jgi:hypothetical protein